MKVPKDTMKVRIFEALSKGVPVSFSDLTTVGMGPDRDRKIESVHQMLTRMVADKEVTRIRRGLYTLGPHAQCAVSWHYRLILLEPELLNVGVFNLYDVRSDQSWYQICEFLQLEEAKDLWIKVEDQKTGSLVLSTFRGQKGISG